MEYVTTPGNIEAGYSRKVRYPCTEDVGEAFRWAIAGCSIHLIHAKATLGDDSRFGLVSEGLLYARASLFGHECQIWQQDKPIAGPVHLRGHDIGGDAVGPEGAVGAAHIGQISIVLAVKSE